MDNSVDFSGNNMYYDFLNLDVSGVMTIDPSFMDLYFIPGISGYDAVANLDVSLNKFNNLFFVNLKLQDMSDNSYNDMKFAMDPSGWNNGSAVSFSSATVNDEDSINPEVIISKQQIKYDLVRFFLSEITGSTKLNSTFRNKTELINSVTSIDASFQDTIVNIISTTGGTFNSPFDYSTINPGSVMMNSILGEDDQGVDNYNDTRKNTLISYFNTKANEIYEQVKGNKYYFYGNTDEGLGWYYPLYIDPSHSDISGVAYHNVQFDNNGRIFYMPDASSNNAITPQPSFDGTYTDYSIVDNSFIPIPFYDGDKLSVKLTYHPKNTVISGNNIGTRSYKVILNLKETPVPLSFSFTYSTLGTGSPQALVGFVDISSNIYAAGGAIGDALLLWNGSTWSNLGSISLGSGQNITNITNYGNNIYVSGTFTSIAGVSGTKKLAKWNNGVWSGVGVGDLSANSINCILEDGTNIYVGGTNFTNAGGVTVSGIAMWNGSTWSPLGTGTSGTINSVQTIQKYRGNIYIGGAFTSAGGVSGTSYIAKWNGATWSPVGSLSSLGITIGQVYRIIFNGPNLYATTSSSPYLLKWDGSTWSNLVTANAGSNIETLEFDLQNIYLGGSFLTLNGVSVKRIAKWDGTNITACGNGFDNAVVKKIKIINQSLYVAGPFTSSNSNTNLKYIVKIV